MLTIQPNFTNYRSKPSFGLNRESLEENKNFYQESVEQLDEFLSNDYVPDSVKKPFKFFRVVGNAAFQGLAVFGSALGIAGFMKKGKAKIDGYNFVKNAKSRVAGLKIGEKFGKMAENIKKSERYQEFKKTPFGAVTVEYAKKANDLITKAVAPLKNMTYDKSTKTVATVLGTGSGLAGGYEEYISENPVITDEEAA